MTMTYKENRATSRHFCVDDYILLKLQHPSNHAFYNKQFQTFFIDQLDPIQGDPRQRIPLS